MPPGRNLVPRHWGSRVCGALLGCMGTVAPAPAEPVPYEMDRENSAVFFEISTLGLWQVSGHFHDFDADIHFDPEDIAASRIEIRVRVDSVDSGSNWADRIIRGGRFLHAEQHPELVFRSTRVALTGENAARVTGMLTVRGVSREETVEAEMEMLEPVGGRDVRTIRARGTFDRTRYGIDYATPFVSRDIVLELWARIQVRQQ